MLARFFAWPISFQVLSSEPLPLLFVMASSPCLVDPLGQPQEAPHLLKLHSLRTAADAVAAVQAQQVDA